MYKAVVRAMIRRNIAKLNEGNPAPTLAMFAHDAELTFPGDNSWSRMFREPQPGRAAYPTHRGKDEIAAFLQRYVENGIQMEVEDILVNGPPWNMRAAVQTHVWVPGPNSQDVYNNRAVLMVRSVWGKLRRQEDYEDSERAAALDRHLASVEAEPAARQPS